MNRFIATLAVALLMLVAADTSSPSPEGFKSPVAKNAAQERDKAVAKAAEAYKQSVIAAQKAYIRRIDSFINSDAVRKIDGEQAIAATESTNARGIVDRCSDASVSVGLIAADQVASAAIGLHKGMTKSALISLLPSKPESDTTDADGTEYVRWVVPTGNSRQTTRVTVQGGVVTDFSVSKTQ